MLSWQTRERRRASAMSTAPARADDGTRATPPSATPSAGRGAARNAPSAAESPTMPAFTTPTPVIATRVVARMSAPPEEEGDVLAAEAERVRDGAVERRVAR